MSLRRLIQSRPCKPLDVKVGAFVSTESVEEERAPHYDPSHFYPVRLHDTLNDRYQIATKLGWGTSSTVWLARDLHEWRWNPTRYVAVKVNANKYATGEHAEKELRLMQHITNVNIQDERRHLARTLLDSFNLVGPSGTHVCMVFEPLCEPLWMLKRRFQGAVLPMDVLKPVVQLLLEGLHYLHTQCHIIHTGERLATCVLSEVAVPLTNREDLKTDNILLALRDKSVLDSVAHDEMQDPLPQKHVDDRTIYLSRNDFGLRGTGLGRPVITDFGLAVYGGGSQCHRHLIQPEEYRAPEVVIDAGWDYSADIWNLGVLIWELLHGSGPFDATESEPFTNERHLARIISILGPPPVGILQRGRRSLPYFHEDGEFKYPELTPACESLENMISVVQVGRESKQSFQDFIWKMLRWNPEERASAGELLSHPWLQHGR